MSLANCVAYPPHCSTNACNFLQEALNELIRDFANPDAGDRFFPFARHMDWYEGHSWAAGITPFAAGKNQVTKMAGKTFSLRSGLGVRFRI